MKINDLMILNKLYLDKGPFIEGNSIKGKVLDIMENIVLVEVEDLGIIKAFTKENLNHQEGKTLTFIVKYSSSDKIELKPILNHMEYRKDLEFTSQPRDCLIDILKGFNIKDD